MLQGKSLEVDIRAGREVWRYHFFIDLGVRWDFGEKGCQLGLVELANLFDREDAWVLGDDVEMVLQAWNVAFFLPIVLDRRQVVRLDVQHFGVVEIVGREASLCELGV